MRLQVEEVGDGAHEAGQLVGRLPDHVQRIELMTYVTCPIMRYHPAVVAQKAASIQILSEGRFTLGLGAGENLNEHVVGRGWPSVNVRHGGGDHHHRRALRRRVRRLRRAALPGRLRAALGPARAAGAAGLRRLL